MLDPMFDLPSNRKKISKCIVTAAAARGEAPLEYIKAKPKQNRDIA